jgi:hypothetical protein
MTQLSRRGFIARGSLGVALAGALAALPGIGAALRTTAPLPQIDASTVTEPLVVHVRDLSSGEMSLFAGTNQIVRRDVELAARLYNAARSER